jgi:transmembrane sensor
MQAEHGNEIDPDAPITEQASGWWMLLNEGAATDADRRAFAEWVACSPERVSAYLQAAQLARALKSPRVQWPDTTVSEVVRGALASGDVVADARGEEEDALNRRTARSDSVLGARTSRPQSQHSRSQHSRSQSARSTSWVPRLAFASMFAIALVAVSFYFYANPKTERFETALGEQRSVMLGDGSLVTLNTTSAIEVRVSKSKRHVTLLAGEALFEVAQDASRPFEVTAGEATVRVLGTRFNVDRHSREMRVIVVEGRVEVSTDSARVPLGAGEQLTLVPKEQPKVSQANAAAATAWTQRQLIFESQPLGEIAAEINRYNRKTIEIQSESLRAEAVTGVFQSNDPASLLAFIARIPGVTVESSPDQSHYIVRMAGQP